MVSETPTAVVKKSDENNKENQTKVKKGEKPVEMSEEDKKLQADLNLMVERLEGTNQSLYGPALELMRSTIRASTTSMTSVPKPLKFMRVHYNKMKEIIEKISDAETKRLCADIISVLAMCSDGNLQDCVNYRLRGSKEEVGVWGHEYVRHLSMELMEEWNKKTEDDMPAIDEKKRNELLSLVHQVVSHNLQHNAEVEACDLLIEIEQLDVLLDEQFAKHLDYERVCRYLLSCSPFLPYPDNQKLIQCAKNLYLRFGKQFEALRCALMLNDVELIKDIFFNCRDRLVKKQMAILLGRQQIFLEIADEELAELNANTHLHRHFMSLVRELDILTPKTPEDIYKTHLEQTRPFQSQSTDTTRRNLADSFVNGLVNCGFCSDALLKDDATANEWFRKNKEYASFSAAASIGLINRWDVDNGLTKCDPFLYGNDNYIKAGALLAIGIIFSGIQDPVDPPGALLLDHLKSENTVVRIGCTLGLGLAYANSKRNTVTGDTGIVDQLIEVMKDSSANAEVKGLAALSLGLILVGTAKTDTAEELLGYLMDYETNKVDFKDPNTRFVSLGIALIYLGTQEQCDLIAMASSALSSLPVPNAEPFGSMTSTLIEICAYAGTGNVLQIQKLLAICSEHYEVPVEKKKDAKKSTAASGTVDFTAPPPAKDKKDEEQQKQDAAEKLIDLSARQAVAVLGIGLIAMGEDIGSQMSLRVFGHLTRYGEPVIRRAVPLALALISVSNPQLTVLETLSKYSHDSDPDTARNAIFALGLVGAGTNNARLTAMLRQLASYHTKDQTTMMLVRLAQGLTHLGKGTMTLSPYHSDRQLMCPAAVAALFATCFAFLDAEHTVLNNRQHYLLYTLVVAIQPRMLITLVEETDISERRQLEQKSVQVRVGQAVDVVAQAGKPRAITGFQTHTTPVLLAHGERAELATDEYTSVTSVLEGLAILKKNEEDKTQKSG